jgi:pimeloyl-ACP methyl ester carboxylesterase
MWTREANASSSGLAYRRQGVGHTVVMLHGIPGGAASWRAVTESLPTTLDVVVPDLLGFGASDRPRHIDDLHARAQATALARLLDELEIPTASVIGHDFGGPVALELARQRPGLVAALGLLATNAFTDTPIPFPLSMVTLPIVGPIAGRLVFSTPSLRMMLRRGVGIDTPPPGHACYLGDRAQRRAIATIFAGSLSRLAELYEPVERQLTQLDIPVYVGWGDRDPFFDIAHGQRTAQAAHTELRVYAGAGHFLPHERPTEVAADILALTRTALPSRTARPTTPGKEGTENPDVDAAAGSATPT